MGRQQRYDRTETVEKAMNLFWRSGFSGTSMRDLEDYLDMRPGSIYANFGSKEHLYRETMDLYAAKSFKSFKALVRNTDSFMSGLHHFIRQLLFTPANPCACMLAKTLADINPDNDALKRKAGDMIANFEDILVVELERARESGEIGGNCDVRALARFIQVQIIGLRSYAEMQKPKAVINQLLNDALAAIKTKAG
ncbi:MAG: TetR family transcriptional regulator [Alphaproteobacteria bacterium]|nr:MAG: TetR family transcriptional regulator [Alphaproteobacteria bacterium]